MRPTIGSVDVIRAWVNHRSWYHHLATGNVTSRPSIGIKDVHNRNGTKTFEQGIGAVDIKGITTDNFSSKHTVNAKHWTTGWVTLEGVASKG